MNMKFVAVAASVALAGSSVPALAASILIDDFSVNQRVVDKPDDPDTPFIDGVNNSQVAGGMIGGYRDLNVETDDGDFSGTELVARDGVLEFNNVTGNTGRGWVTYDGSNTVGSNPSNVTTSGLDVDLLRGGSETLTGFVFDIVSVDMAGLFIEIRAWDMGGNLATFNEVLPVGGGNPFVPFAAFTGGIDWSDIGALQFFAQTGPDGNLIPALDGAIDSIRVEVIPVPASVLLLLGGMGGLGALRLRKRKS